MSKEEDKKYLVFDIGSENTSIGWAGDDEPYYYFKTYCFYNHFEEKYEFGITNSQSSTLSTKYYYPLENGIIINFDLFTLLLEYIYSYLNVNSNEYPLLLTYSIFSPKEVKEKLLNLLFNKFNIPSVFLTSQGLLTLLCNGKDNGCVIDIGHTCTNILAIYGNCHISYACKVIPIGGKHITSYLSKLIREHKYSFTENENVELFTSIKENTCIITNDSYDNIDDKIYTLFDGQEISIKGEIRNCAELLFNPSLDNKDSALNIMDNYFECVQKCDKHTLFIDMYGNTIICGGSSKIEGLASRIEKEVRNFGPSSLKYSVKLNDSSCNAWIGGSILASVSKYQQSFIKKEDYKQYGIKSLERMML